MKLNNHSTNYTAAIAFFDADVQRQQDRAEIKTRMKKATRRLMSKSRYAR